MLNMNEKMSSMAYKSAYGRMAYTNNDSKAYNYNRYDNGHLAAGWFFVSLTSEEIESLQNSTLEYTNLTKQCIFNINNMLAPLITYDDFGNTKLLFDKQSVIAYNTCGVGYQLSNRNGSVIIDSTTRDENHQNITHLAYFQKPSNGWAFASGSDDGHGNLYVDPKCWYLIPVSSIEGQSMLLAKTDLKQGDEIAFGDGAQALEVSFKHASVKTPYDEGEA